MGKAGILAGFDAVEWASTALFHRGGSDVNGPALATLHDGGHYPDALALLNGYASCYSISAYLATVWTGIGGAGTMTMGIDSDGYCYVNCTANDAFNVIALADADGDWPFGFVDTTASVAYGSGQRATATRAWKRGNIEIRSAFGPLGIERVAGGGPSSFPRRAVYHALPTAIQGLTTPDLDGVAETLEKWDNAVNDATNKRICWGIDSEGRTYTSHESTAGALGITWLSASFRRALGFTGSETQDLTAGRYKLTSTYPARGVLVLRQGLAMLTPSRSWSGAASNTLGGRVVGRGHSAWRDLDVQFSLTGGVGLTEANSPYRDEEQIYLHRVTPYLHRASRCTVLPEWGDPRRGHSLVAQFADEVSSPLAQSAIVRSDAGGVMGRKRCEVATDAAQDHAMQFAASGPRLFTAPLSLRLRVLPDV